MKRVREAHASTCASVSNDLLGRLTAQYSECMKHLGREQHLGVLTLQIRQ